MLIAPRAHALLSLSRRTLRGLLCFALILFGIHTTHAQSNEWTWMGGLQTAGHLPVYGASGQPYPGISPGSRTPSMAWTDPAGNFWLFGGTGFDVVGRFGYLNDMWEYNPTNGSWTWFTGNTALGPNTGNTPGVYGTQGVASAANTPGGRSSALTWADSSGNLWLYGGVNRSDSTGYSDYFSDLWKFSTTTHQWTWVSGPNTPNHGSVYGVRGTPAAENTPGPRSGSAHLTDSQGNFWLFGGSCQDATGTAGSCNDLWKYNPSSGQWTWVNGPNVANQTGVFGTFQQFAANNIPESRYGTAAWIDTSDNIWIFSGGSSNINDFWEYNVTLGQWAWMGGSTANTTMQPGAPTAIPGVYGTLQVPSPTNIPGSGAGLVTWRDHKGNLWLFGGTGGDSTSTIKELNNVWEFDISLKQWIWMAGPTTVTYCPPEIYNCAQYGIYGTLGVPDLRNTPGGRQVAVGWTDLAGNFWLYAGVGPDASGTVGNLDDLWKFEPNTNAATVTATPTFSPAAGTYTAWQTVSITSATPSATIRYTIDGGPTLQYSGPITVAKSQTITAIASATGLANSNTAAATYVENLPQAAAPTFSIPTGTYTTAQTVAISDSTPGATLYYTTDGTAPTAASTTYSGPVSIATPTTLKAIAIAPGYLASTVTSVPYFFGTNPTAYWIWEGGDKTVSPNNCYGVVCGSPGWYGTRQVTSAANIPPGRYYASSWTDADNNFWVFGGSDFNSYLRNDLWEYQPSLGKWTWISGSSSETSGYQGVYGTRGVASPNNTPGARNSATAWTDASGNLWLYGGNGDDSNGHFGRLNDLWKFTPSTRQWTWIGGKDVLVLDVSGTGNYAVYPPVYGTLGIPSATNTPGGRTYAAGTTDTSGNLWLYGGYGADFRGTATYLDDIWKFNPATLQWTWMGGSQFAISSITGQSLHGDAVNGYFGPANYNGNTWMDTAGNFWMFGGTQLGSTSNVSNDTWTFSPSNSRWQKNNAVTAASTYANYGTLGVWSATNYPGAHSDATRWTDHNGNIWIFGGQGRSASVPQNGVILGQLNDLWEFKPAMNQWAWMGGSTGYGQAGNYGTLGTPAATNLPGARFSAANFVDSKGNLWLFSGFLHDSNGAISFLNDLWQYSVTGTPTVVPLYPQAAAPVFSLPSGTYATAQSLTITDSTPGAVIYYTTDGTDPTSSSPIYAGPLTIATSQTVKAVAAAPDYTLSPITSATYVFSIAATPTFTPPAGTYTSAQNVTIASTTAGAVIYYSTDGTTPTTSSTRYTGAITVSTTQTIKAIATASGYSTSAVASATYVINQPSFTLQANPTALTVYRGNQGTVALTLTPLNGFNSNISLSCSGLPTGTTCSFSPASLTVAGSAAKSTMTIAVSSQAAQQRAPQSPMKSPIPLGTTLAAVAVFYLRGKHRRWRQGLLLALATIATGLLLGCTNIIEPLTPRTATITVTATAPTTQQTTQVTLTVD